MFMHFLEQNEVESSFLWSRERDKPWSMTNSDPNPDLSLTTANTFLALKSLICVVERPDLDQTVRDMKVTEKRSWIESA